MRKISSFALTLLMVCGLFVSNLTVAFAGIEGAVLDQANEPGTKLGAATIYTYSDRTQTFKPTKTKIVAVDVYLKDRINGSDIILKILDDGGQSISTTTHELTVPGEGWETFAFSSPYVSVTPGSTYTLKLNVSDNQTKWSFGSNAYSNGVFGVSSDRDAFFRVYGMGDPAPEEGGDEVSTPENTAVDPDVSPEPEKDQLPVEESESVEDPELGYVEVNGDITEAPVEEVEVSKGDILNIAGTAPKDSKVVIFIGEYSYTVEVDEDGNWSLELDHSVLDKGEFSVEAQTQLADESGSEKVKLFTLVKATSNEVATSTKKDPTIWEKVLGEWIFYTYGVLLALLLILLIVLHFTQKKHLTKHADKKKDRVSELDSKVDLSKLDKISEKPKKTGKKKIIDIS